MFIFPSDTIFVKFMSRIIENTRFDSDTSNQITHEGDSYSGQYGALRSADPYGSFSYKIGPFEDFFRSLGFRTAYDKYAEQMALASKAYQADVSQKEYDEAYNSPVAQAARMRQAGLNPDLQGTSGVEAASVMSSEDNPLSDVPGPDFGSGDATRDPMAFANMIMSALTMSVGFAKDTASLQQLGIANANGQIGNAENILKLAYDTILNFTPSVRELDMSDGNVVFDPTDLMPRVLSHYSGVMSKKQFKQFYSAVSNMISSLPVEKEQYKQWRERAEARKGYFIGTNTNYSESDELMLGIGHELGELGSEIEKMQYRNAKSEEELRSIEISNDKAYANSIDPKLRAESENSSYEYNTLQKEASSKVEASMNRIMDFLEQKANNGNHLASIALAILGAFRLMSVSNVSLPSPSISSSRTNRGSSFKLSF